MARTRLRQIVRFPVIPKGPLVLPHGINLDGVPQVPDQVIAVSAGAIDVTVTSTEVTVTNLGDAATSADVWLYYDHTIDRAYGPDSQMLPGMVPRAFIVIARPGGGAAVAEQVFTYIATGLEGSDFFIPLPAVRANDNYVPQVTNGGVANILAYDQPDLGATDRKVNEFRVISSGALTAGDRLDCVVAQRT